MSEVVNLYDVDASTATTTTRPATARVWRASARRSAPQQLGGSVYELDPGESICPYHYEYPEEEWLLVLAGTPTLRDPDGEHELAPGDLVCFPRARRARTRSRTAPTEPARIADALDEGEDARSPSTPTATRSASGRSASSSASTTPSTTGTASSSAPRCYARACTGESAGAHEQSGETSPLEPFSCR